MKILAIDTTTELCSAALSIDGEVIFRQQLDATGHSRLILPMVQALLAEAGLGLNTIDLLACDNGPGSFTGLRIGLGVAQGLAYGADLPLCGIPSLAALAAAIKPVGADADVQVDGSKVLVAIDARMGEVYWGLYGLDMDAAAMLAVPMGLCQPSEIVGDMASDITKLSNSEAVIGIGSGWDAYLQPLSAQITLARWQPGAFPHAREVAMLAAQVPASDYLGAAQLTPVYLRNNVAKVGKRTPLLEGAGAKRS